MLSTFNKPIACLPAAGRDKLLYITYWKDYKRDANKLRETLKARGYTVALDDHKKETKPEDIKKRFSAVSSLCNASVSFKI